jgi:hypothetical protein
VTADVEAIASPWLRDRDRVTDIVDQRVYTAIPKSPVFPLVRLTLIDERQVYQPRHLTSTLLQLDCYGGPKATARDLADAVADELANNFPGAHEGGVVTSVECALRYLPDDTYDPAKPRYVVSAEIFSRP